PEREHVQAEMDRTVVQERRGDQAPPLAVSKPDVPRHAENARREDRVLEVDPVSDERTVLEDPARVAVDARAAGEFGQVDEHVRDHEQPGDAELGEYVAVTRRRAADALARDRGGPRGGDDGSGPRPRM